MSPEVGRACVAKRREGEGVAVLRRLRHGGAHSLRRKSPRGPGLRHWAHVEPPRSDAGGLLAGPACPPPPPPSHLKLPVRERLGVVARHATHMASRRDGGRAAGMALDIGPNSRRRYTAAAAQATARPAGGAAVTQLAPLGRVN